MASGNALHSQEHLIYPVQPIWDLRTRESPPLLFFSQQHSMPWMPCRLPEGPIPGRTCGDATNRPGCPRRKRPQKPRWR